jgi:hypothetical protein
MESPTVFVVESELETRDSFAALASSLGLSACREWMESNSTAGLWKLAVSFL